MQHVSEIIAKHPQHAGLMREALIECITTSFDCAQTCAACADACLAEEDVKDLVRCVRLNHDCSDICVTTGRLLSRQTEPDTRLLHRQLELCAMACDTCAHECLVHVDHAHCRVCAEACRVCAHSCRELMAKLTLRPD